MFAPTASEQVSQSNLRRTIQQGGDGLQRALAGTPVQMLLMLQRTVGNQAVNQLLRQYKSSRQPAPGLIMPAVQRCGGTPCNCSPKEKAAHAQVQSMEEEQGLPASAGALSSVQRDSDEDEGTDADATKAAEQGADVAGSAEAASSEGATDATDSAGQSAAEPAQDATEGASASNDMENATAADTDDPADRSAEEPAQDSSEGASASDDTDDTSAAQTGDDSAQGGDEQAADPADSDDAAADDVDLSPIPAISGEEDSHDEDVFGGTMDVKGKTHASFVHKFAMPIIIPTKGDASSCSCDAKNCVHISGTMTSTFTMDAKPTLPVPPDGLTAHQTKIYQSLIDTCISPHEQQHVTAFNAYAGTEQTPFDLTCCRADVHSSLQAIHDGVEKTRHDAAQTASDALDPFLATFDRTCADDADLAACTTCPPSKV